MELGVNWFRPTTTQGKCQWVVKARGLVPWNFTSPLRPHRIQYRAS